MRLTAISILLSACICGCANNSDSHLTPTLVSTKPKAVTPVNDKANQGNDTGVDVGTGYPEFADPLSSTTQTTKKTSGITFKPSVEPKGTSLTAGADTVAPVVQNKPGPITAQVSQNKVAPTPSETNAEINTLSKQETPHFPYLRVVKTIPGRLQFDVATKEFVFWITADSLISNINTLLTATDGGQAIYESISGNHSFPNSFEIRGKTIPDLIDQMVGPFKKPSQILQVVHINKIVLIRYSRGVTAHAN